jgi:hypothetical protein
MLPLLAFSAWWEAACTAMLRLRRLPPLPLLHLLTQLRARFQVQTQVPLRIQGLLRIQDLHQIQDLRQIQALYPHLIQLLAQIHHLSHLLR